MELRPDTLDQENRRFSQREIDRPLFLNSIPKAGSHLLRNILRMFVPVDQHYRADFIQHATLGRHGAAFHAAVPMLSWGHLPFSDAAAIATGHARQVLLVRDPYSWVLARARFFRSDAFQGPLDTLKTPDISTDQFINLMIFGMFQKMPGLAEVYTHHAIAWLGTGIFLVRYEELCAAVATIDEAEGEAYFARLFDACGIVRPADWRERVRIGAARAQSGTARANLAGPIATVPDMLSPIQKALVDYAAPQVRALLGYAPDGSTFSPAACKC
ncbi:MAG: hypothetical protein AB7E60_08585 [Sphingobium sp.]